MDLAALKAKAAAVSPMGTGEVPILHGRVLGVDGDGLAYYCAGKDGTSVADAKARVDNKIKAMKAAAMAEKVIIFLTGSGGHKGHRYAIARVKPYQGQRVNSRRPANWPHLRAYLEGHPAYGNLIVYDREADDLFGQYGAADPTNFVTGTQDKDMQMVPGWHLDWESHRLFYLAPDQFEVVWNDDLYGEKFFWKQMLMGDTADHIPGLPWMVVKGKKVRVGEVTADKLLANAHDRESAFETVATAYRSFYAERWYVEMLEQGVLLWMRRKPQADWFEVAAQDGPLYYNHGNPLRQDDPHYQAWQELTARVKEAQAINDLSTQGE